MRGNSDLNIHSLLACSLALALFFAIGLPTAHAQWEELNAPAMESPNKAVVVGDILTCRDSGKLLEKLTELIEREQLWVLGDGNLPWSTMPISGWRWEARPRDDGRIILAIERDLLVAIYESKHAGIRMSLLDVAHANAFQSRFSGQSAIAPKHVTAMSVKHFSRKSPELFKLYYRYAGPTREIVSSKALPKPAWAHNP